MKKRYHSSITAFVITLLMLFGMYALLGFAPFGHRALTWEDANIQYLDFFAYFKDILAGKNDVTYSFGKTLGGTNIAVFSYYLSSPFSLLVAFFDQTQFHTFFNLTIALKLALAAATCSLFLNRRFDVQRDDGYRNAVSVLLSLGYALSHYCVTQNSNIMWMDGVYMLPLILLAVYELVQGRGGWKLAIAVGVSILFNWYSAGLNCLFSAVYCLLEILLKNESTDMPVRRRFADSAGILGRYVLAMMVGVLLSAALFLPTIAAMGNGNRGSLDWAMLLDFSFLGELPELLNGFILGYISSRGKPALFCGSLALLGFMGFFTAKDVRRSMKLIAGFIFGLLVLSLYFNPLVMVFSLLKECESYWYRYTYGIMLMMIWFSAYFYMHTDGRANAYQMIKNALVFAMALLLVNYIRTAATIRTVYLTCMVFFAVASAASLLLCWKARAGRALVTLMLALAVMAELVFNAKMQFGYYSKSDVGDYQTYVSGQRQQIQEIQNADHELYRISQTSTRNMYDDGITANYNEALGFNYWSIAGYTSSPDDIQREMLERLGYRMSGLNMCIVNTSILPADSLLGVRYVLSRSEINGLKRIDSFSISDGKCVYENPFALPMAFVYQDKGIELNEYENPFLYQNEIYSQLLGERIELFSPVSYELTQHESGGKIIAHTYTLKLPQGNIAVYGNLPWEHEMLAELSVNDRERIQYSRWLSASVFYIPTAYGDQTASVTLDASNSKVMLADEQFYALDLDLLSDVSARIAKGSVMEHAVIENGHARFNVDGAEGEKLFVSIPYDRGWKITLNGKEIEPGLVAGCMYAIELTDGENLVEMTYRVRFLREGMLLSCAGVVLALLMALHHKKKNRIRE